MKIEQLKNNLGDYAKDIRLNLSMVLSEEGAPQLTKKQIYLIALACAYTTKNNEIISALFEDCQLLLADNEYHAAKSAATIMAMNNVYYRFTHLISDKNLGSLPAKLRMNVIGNPGVNKTDFELACLAISAINGCGLCMDSHVRELQKANMSHETIQSAVRIASVINATATAIEIQGSHIKTH